MALNTPPQKQLRGRSAASVPARAWRVHRWRVQTDRQAGRQTVCGVTGRWHVCRARDRGGVRDQGQACVGSVRAPFRSQR
eukprot:2778948-Rhodomonas_salina.1